MARERWRTRPVQTLDHLASRASPVARQPSGSSAAFRLPPRWHSRSFSRGRRRRRLGKSVCRLILKSAQLSPRTFCTFAREFSPLGRQRATDGQRSDPGLGSVRLIMRSPARCSGPSPADGPPEGGAVGKGGQEPGVTRPRRMTDTSRRTPIGWPLCVLGARRPLVTSGPPAPRPRCRSTFRPASVRETRSAEGRGCVPRRRTRPDDGRWRCYRASVERAIDVSGTPPRFHMEFENLNSVSRQPRPDEPSTWAFTFSTPASATTGAVSEGVAL